MLSLSQFRQERICIHLWFLMTPVWGSGETHRPQNDMWVTRLFFNSVHHIEPPFLKYGFKRLQIIWLWLHKCEDIVCSHIYRVSLMCWLILYQWMYMFIFNLYQKCTTCHQFEWPLKLLWLTCDIFQCHQWLLVSGIHIQVVPVT